MLTTDPKVKIMSLLTGNWTPANTNGQTPKVHTGWYNASWGDIPQVTITHPVYSVIDGGETGVTAMGGNGTLVRLMSCMVTVGCWASFETKTSAGVAFKNASINAKDFTYNCAAEVKRIIEANMFTDSDLEFITWMDMNEQVDTRIQPVVFRYDNSVRLVWKDAF